MYLNLDLLSQIYDWKKKNAVLSGKKFTSFKRKYGYINVKYGYDTEIVLVSFKQNGVICIFNFKESLPKAVTFMWCGDCMSASCNYKGMEYRHNTSIATFIIFCPNLKETMYTVFQICETFLKNGGNVFQLILKVCRIKQFYLEIFQENKTRLEQLEI